MAVFNYKLSCSVFASGEKEWAAFPAHEISFCAVLVFELQESEYTQ